MKDPLGDRMKDFYEDRITYYEGEIQKELERCKSSNDWMEKFFESIKK